MVVRRRGLSYQAAGQAPQVSLVRIIDQAAWSQAVVDSPQLKGFNPGLSLKQHRLPVLPPLEEVAMMHFEALSSYRLAQERGNKRKNEKKKSSDKRCSGSSVETPFVVMKDVSTVMVL